MALILFFHWICDFLFQSRWMAENKSKDIFALVAHALVYTTGLWALCSPFYGTSAFAFAGLNGLLHFCVDLISCHVTSFFYEKKDMYLFFATIGLDQYIHFLCLWFTFQRML